MGNDKKLDDLDNLTDEKLRQEIRSLRSKDEEIEDLVKDIHEFLFEEDDVTGRRVVDDISLVRRLNNNFSGFSAALGFIIGLFTVGIPIVLGLLKMWEILSKYLR